MRLLVLSLCSSLLAPGSPLPPSPACFDCPSSIDGHPFPAFVPITPWFGPSNAPDSTSYSLTGLATPLPIPMGLEVIDDDTLLAYCGDDCEEVGIPGVWSADWSASSSSGSAGVFVNPQGTSVASVADASHVVYLPPRNLLPGETRVITVAATLIDTCSMPSVVDPGGTASLQVTVYRKPSGRFDVSAVYAGASIPLIPIPFCSSGTGDCDRFFGFDPYLSPNVTITHAPVTAPQGEARMIQSVAEDIDRYGGKCGNDQRQSFAVTEYCDRLTYDWAVVGGPGNGTFLAEGRSAIFVGTAPGSILIQLTVSGTDGEVAVTTHSFTVL